MIREHILQYRLPRLTTYRAHIHEERKALSTAVVTGQTQRTNEIPHAPCKYRLAALLFLILLQVKQNSSQVSPSTKPARCRGTGFILAPEGPCGRRLFPGAAAADTHGHEARALRRTRYRRRICLVVGVSVRVVDNEPAWKNKEQRYHIDECQRYTERLDRWSENKTTGGIPTNNGGERRIHLNDGSTKDGNGWRVVQKMARQKDGRKAASNGLTFRVDLLYS